MLVEMDEVLTVTELLLVEIATILVLMDEVVVDKLVEI